MTVPKDALALWAGEGETGFETAGSEDFQIPFLQLLQKGSPQVDDAKPEYKKEAKVGQFYDPATDELMDELSVIPCHYKAAMVEWKPDMGGFAGVHPVGFEKDLKRNDKGQYVLESGNLLVDTRYFFCLRKTDSGDLAPVIIALSSSQIKRAKTWMTRMRSRKIEKPDGTNFTPPMWSSFWNLTSTSEQNDKFTWKGWKMEKGDDVTDADVFKKAKETREMFMASENNINPSAPAQDGDDSGAM